ncbi:MAG: flagellar biosynthesis protein FlhF [Bacteroidetes bacterium]|jgi:flagellar biosynthesis protein FlhF|nr:flagellar biosynthesis protein FlhF [Bacteroidota bacterium]
MRIKKFTGATAKEAADKMRAEFGEDAVILNTRRVAKGGLLGIGGGEYFEVTAAYDEAPVKAPPQLPAGTRPAAVRADDDVLGSLRQLASSFEDKRKNDQPHRQPVPQNAQPHLNYDNEILKQELSDVKSALGEIAQHIKRSKMPVLSESLKSVYSSLIDSEVEEEIALEIVQVCNHKLSGAEIENQLAVDKFVTNSIAQRIQEAPVRRGGRKGYVIAVVGPTGVGKTTTIAKLASISKLVKGESVALITADTYRIGAIDQLKAFADIASIPMSVVYTPDEMIAAIRKYSSFDTIYIDTVGRSQRSADRIVELGRFIDAADPNEVHLVMSANFSLSTVRDIYKKFRSLKPNRLLITKTDEAVSLGMVLSLARESRLPFSFLTNGQSVPDDIEPASGANLANMIYKTGVETNA